MPVVKVQHNMRITTDFNVSMSIEAVIDTEEEAKELGREMAVFFLAYTRGAIEEDADTEGP